MKFHDTLNEKIWNGLELKPEVKEKLKEISDAFKEYLDINEDAILDIRITGSSASYNYTKYSDLDLHFIVDYEKVHEDCPLVEGYLWSYKSQFNDNHDISIYGVPVELYAEDSTQGAVSNGVYSLIEDKWLKKPEKIEPTDNDAAVKAKFDELKEAVDNCDDSEVAEQLQTKIYTMRKAGLAEEGEFSTENLAFKQLRNAGCLDKLKQLKKEQIDKQLSLESLNKKLQDKLAQNTTINEKDQTVMEMYKKMNEDKIMGTDFLGPKELKEYPKGTELHIEFNNGPGQIEVLTKANKNNRFVWKPKGNVDPFITTDYEYALKLIDRYGGEIVADDAAVKVPELDESILVKLNKSINEALADTED